MSIQVTADKKKIAQRRDKKREEIQSERAVVVVVVATRKNGKIKRRGGVGRIGTIPYPFRGAPRLRSIAGHELRKYQLLATIGSRP